MSLESLRVVPFTQDRVPNEYPGGDLPWQVWHTVRNALVNTCREYGPTGPMGVVPIVHGAASPYAMMGQDRNFWEPGDPDPWYYILTDQPNDERYCYAELYGDDPLRAEWLLSVAATLRQFDGWGLGISNIPGSYLLIFDRKLMAKGRLAKCRSALEVVETTRHLLKSGS